MSKISEFIRKRLGALPSPADPRHYRVRLPTKEEVIELPEEFDGLLPYHDNEKWYSQGDIGSCVGWAGKIAMGITNYLLDLVADDLSAGWLYKKSRDKSIIPPGVEGSTNLGLMKALKKIGATTEECCPTDTKSPWDGINPCTDIGNPESEHYPGKYAIDSYWYVNPFVTDFQSAIYGVTHEAPYKMPDGSQGKIPLIVAFPVYESFYDALEGGIVPIPEAGERLLGGHASVLRGWGIIDDGKYFKNTGSWGRTGDDGTYHIPFGYPFYEGWLIHNGPFIESGSSSCAFGNFAAKVLSLVPWGLRRQGRFRYVNP